MDVSGTGQLLLERFYDSLLVVLFFLFISTQKSRVVERLFVLDGRSRIFSYGLSG
jgi:hypothetical protein